MLFFYGEALLARSPNRKVEGHHLVARPGLLIQHIRNHSPYLQRKQQTPILKCHSGTPKEIDKEKQHAFIVDV
jgi:hypothetical protein